MFSRTIKTDVFADYIIEAKEVHSQLSWKT